MKTLTPEYQAKVLDLLRLEPDLIRYETLSTWSDLSRPILDIVIKKKKYYYNNFFKNNRVPNDLVLTAFEGYKETKYSPGSDSLQHIVNYGDEGLLIELSKNLDILNILINMVPKWYRLLGVDTQTEAIGILKEKKPWHVVTGIISKIIKTCYLDETAVGRIIFSFDPIISKELFTRQILTEQQLIKMNVNMYEAWKYYPLSEETAKKYQPDWTNKGDVEMISPNMPDEWAKKIITSKKDNVMARFARYGPQRYLPLLIGKEVKKTWYEFSAVLEARISGKPEAIWEKVYHNFGVSNPCSLIPFSVLINV